MLDARERAVLARMWGEEWEVLTPAQQDAVAEDFALASGADRRDYAFHIGTGRLARYADALLAGRA